MTWIPPASGEIHCLFRSDRFAPLLAPISVPTNQPKSPAGLHWETGASVSLLSDQRFSVPETALGYVGFGGNWGCVVVYMVFWSICGTREGVEDLAHKYLVSFWDEKVSSE